jgi:DNA polymerase-1
MEADDVIATLAARAEREGMEVVIVTGDKDMVQLVTDRVTLWSPVGRTDEYVRVDRPAVRQKWGVTPEQFRDVLALMGDTIDNIPGVPGVGEKTARELIAAFGSLDALYRRLDEVKKPALRAKLGAHREQAFTSRELVTLRTDCELPCDWEELRMGPIRREELLELARHYELKRLERLALEQGIPGRSTGAPRPGRAPEPRAGRPAGAEMAAGAEARAGREGLAAAEGPAPAERTAAGRAARGTAPAEAAATEVLPPQGALDLWAEPAAARSEPWKPEAIEARVRALRAQAAGGLALLPLVEGDHPRRARLVGVGLAARDGSFCYVPLAHESGPNATAAQLDAWLGGALADPAVPKLGEDLKRDALALEAVGLSLPLPGGGALLDAHVLSCLCDPERDHSVEGMVRDFLGVAPPAPAAGRRPRLASLPVEAGAYAARGAAALFPLVEAMRAQLESREQWGVYETLERPLIEVLLDMERSGIAVDVAALQAMARQAAEEIAALRAELIALAGEEINLDSGPQVARVLFETLGLKPRGRTPGGALSTRQEVLEELAATHSFPRRLLEYRALTKLQSTYFEALPAEVDPADGRVHTSYEQAGAATGRLSSSHPNLQNIPMRTERGRLIRRAFVAPPGAVLVGADYSQIELRVMAHLSEDPALVAAFASGEDVHASTARRVFGVRGGVDPTLRSRAKVVNFGVMYGMGARSLSQQMGIPLAEAQTFIGDYFRAFAKVREFLDRTVEEARSRGYVRTLLGRRRYLPGLESAHGAERSFAARAAINAPIQGSAADLMKLAMTRVHAVLKRRFPSARLLLQVHDELLLESPAAEADAVAAAVRAEMEGCFPLRVPLVVSVGSGRTWFDVH